VFINIQTLFKVKKSIPTSINQSHYFLVSRMFSGLFETISNREWNPTGIPAFVKLAEQLAKTKELTWLISCKTERESEIVGNKFLHLKIDQYDIFVIPYLNIFHFAKLNSLLNDLITIFYCIYFTSKTKKRLFYFDRSNIKTAAFVKLILRQYVVIRILGLYPGQKKLVSNPISRFRRISEYYAYRVKYDLAVCTQDGSGIEFYLDRLLNIKTPRVVVLNGVVRHKFNFYKKDKNYLSLLFVGTLAESKGVLDLIDALSLLKSANIHFKATIIGKGDLEEHIQKTIFDKNLTDFVKLIGAVEHNKIYRYYEEADVYISLNKLGNLSNTVLESMTLGNCVILLGKDPINFTDVFTEKFVSGDKVIFISRESTVESLVNVLVHLHENYSLISEYSSQMKKFADENLWTWDERINYEIELLEGILN